MKNNKTNKWNIRNICVNTLFIVAGTGLLFPLVDIKAVGWTESVQEPKVQAQIKAERQKRDYFSDMKGLEYQAQRCIDHAIQVRINGYGELEVERYISEARQYYTRAIEVSKKSPFTHPSTVERLERELGSLDALLRN